MNKLSYELAKELKEAGFPQSGNGSFNHGPTGKIYNTLSVYVPTLSELIEACGEGFRNLSHVGDKWWCNIEDSEVRQGFYRKIYGKTPQEAVARLYIALNKKS